MPPTSRRFTLNRTYKERNSAVWCGTVQCTFSCSLLRRISGIICFIMTNEVIIRCQEHQRLVYGVYPRTPIYPQYTPGTNQKFGRGAWARFVGPVPPGPRLKPPLSMTLKFIGLRLWCCSAVYYSHACWIGLYKSASNTSYYWLDGNPSMYRNWESGAPSNDTRQCVRIYNSKFRNRNCTGGIYTYRYACKGIYYFQR